MKTVILYLVLFVCAGGLFAQSEDAVDEFDEFDEFAEFEAELQAQVDEAQVSDPLEPLNRGIWWVNDKLYTYLLKPVATGYKKVVPDEGRQSVANAFDNIRAPERVVNNVLQRKWSAAGTELKRFACNSTVGVLGLRDPATERYEMEEYPEDFGQTLASYGVNPMMTLHLPLLGPSNLRDTIGLIPDLFMDPLYYIESLPAKISIKTEEVVNDTSLRLGLYEDLKKEHVDMYRFMQNAYEQNRLKKIEE